MCLTPITINKNTPDAMTVGCGRCMPCHLKYCNQWVFRFTIHANHNPLFYCVTLTYDGKHLPYVKGKNGKLYMSLMRSHASNFFKTLRNNHKKQYKQCAIIPKITYLICGEYGDKFKRPHYHSIIFGATPEAILKSWKHGMVHFGESDLRSTVNYALKYAMKSRIYKYQKDRYYERPFINVSKGIGEDLLKPYTVNIIDKATGELSISKQYYYKNLPEVITTVDNIKLMLPRYYTKKLGINIDTTQFKNAGIDKQRKMDAHLERQGLTKIQWSKMYHKWLYFQNKEQHYNNEILTDVPIDFIKDYS